VAEVVAILVAFGGFAGIAYGLWRAATWARQRGVGTSLIAPIDEIWHPIAYDAHQEIQVQDERLAPRFSPEDK
jgi:hypothetical protein